MMVADATDSVSMAPDPDKGVHLPEFGTVWGDWPNRAKARGANMTCSCCPWAGEKACIGSADLSAVANAVDVTIDSLLPY